MTLHPMPNTGHMSRQAKYVQRKLLEKCLPNLSAQFILSLSKICRCLATSTLSLTSAVPPSFLPCRRLFIRSSCKALIAHLVSISGLSADNWSITPPPPPPKSRNRRRKAAMFRRRRVVFSTLAKHGPAAFPRASSERRSAPRAAVRKLAPPSYSLAHALLSAAAAAAAAVT